MRNAKLVEMGSSRSCTNGRRAWLRPLGVGVALALGLASIFSPRTASADDSSRMNIDWGKLGEAIHTGGATLFSKEGFGTVAPSPPQEFNRWVGVTPHLSLVARDWSGVQALMGGHVSLTDQLRLSRSIRMVVARVRLADGRFAPFVQLGVGQWRVDTELLPMLPRDTELAMQNGAGFELRFARSWRVALEIDHTVLYRETREPQQVSGPYLLGAFLAIHTAF
jgi:hypothetical protein